MGRRETADRQGRIELELMEERAAALRRISQTLESLIDELTRLRAHIGEVPAFAQSAAARPRRAGPLWWTGETALLGVGSHCDPTGAGGHWSNPSPDVTRYRELRRRAVRYRWYLEVQREALGLHPDHRLDEFYSIPPPL
jgi:hypothetical protein